MNIDKNPFNSIFFLSIILVILAYILFENIKEEQIFNGKSHAFLRNEYKISDPKGDEERYRERLKDAHPIGGCLSSRREAPAEWRWRSS